MQWFINKSVNEDCITKKIVQWLGDELLYELCAKPPKSRSCVIVQRL